MAVSKVAARFGVHPRTVRRWVSRAAGQRLESVDWESRSTTPQRTTRTATELEDQVLAIRVRLKETSVLGEYGADAILRELDERGQLPLSRSTISRILVRRGVVEKQRRARRRAPLKGWYLPSVARGEAELDSFDYIEDLVIRGGTRFCVLTGVSLAGGVPAAFLHDRRAAALSVRDLILHWKRHGLPAYAQFDNDVVFQGTHRHPNAIGRVARLCLSLGIVPVYAPPYEHGAQNLVEGFNAMWRQKVWRRREWKSLSALRSATHDYLHALLARRAARRESAPVRRPFPKRWQLNYNAPFAGTLVQLRRADDSGHVTVLGRRIEILRSWSNRAVRAEVDFNLHEIRIWGLRKREPNVQPLLRSVPHLIEQKRFRGRD